jgi:hypothetical protein
MMAMKFGLALPYNVAQLVPQLAQLAEKTGWDGFFLGDAIWLEDPLIALSAAAMVTSRIRLGPLVIPVPLRRPWKIASESVALDRLSNGRLTLGLGVGAVWMGWHGFPDEVTGTRARAEMLDETIDILTLLFQGKPFDFDGQHYHLKLTALDEVYYPPRPVQQPRIPLWVPGLWPRKKSMQRILRCDGVLPEKPSVNGQPQAVTPADIRDITAYVEANRTLTTPFDIVVIGKTRDMDNARQSAEVMRWAEAGATWWIEDLFGDSQEAVGDHIRQGPPMLL